MRFSSVAFGLPYLLIELHCIGVPVVRRTVYSHVITKFSRMSVGLADETVADPDLRIRGGGGVGGHPDPDFFGPSGLTLA